MASPESGLERFRERIVAAAAMRATLRPRGGGTKDFYGGALAGEVLDTRDHAGIVAYEPTELYVTARCGTTLAELERALDDQGQMLAFEPPRYGDGGTVGGMVASALSGPRRVQCGPLRDFVLGVQILDGRGQVLRFGGQVMKNVAGYDVSRLVCGSLGTLALIAEVTLKVLPRPAAELSLRFELPQDEALRRLDQWAGRPLPLSASAWHAGVLCVRLSGGASAVALARERLGGEALPDVEAGEFWRSLRDHAHPFFEGTVWRLALPPAAALPALPGEWLLEWHGGQRWLRGEVEAARVREAAARAGGHAVLFRADDAYKRRIGAFAPLDPAVQSLHRRVRQVFDPDGVFDRGRLHPAA